MQFILTARFTQDCIKNLFSQIRLKHVIPHPLQFIQDLKLISIYMFIKNTNSSNYDNDKSSYNRIFGILTKTKRQMCCETHDDNNNVLDINTLPAFDPHKIQLSNLELNLLYNIAWYIIKSISQKCKICATCLLSVGSKCILLFFFLQI